MPIKVRLRKGDKTIPKLVTRNTTTNATTECDMPVISGREDVRAAMEAAVRQEQKGGRGVCREHVLELTITAPNMPNLDLLDLPGIVSSAVKGKTACLCMCVRARVYVCVCFYVRGDVARICLCV